MNAAAESRLRIHPALALGDCNMLLYCAALSVPAMCAGLIGSITARLTICYTDHDHLSGQKHPQRRSLACMLYALLRRSTLLEFNRPLTHILRVFHSADIGISPTTPLHVGHGCFVLGLVAGS